MTDVGYYYLIMCIVSIIIFAGTLAYQSFRYRGE